MSRYTAQDLEALHKQAQQVQQLLAAQAAARETDYANKQAALNAQREDALRQAYMRQQQAISQLPGQMAASGINGGLAESSLVQLQRSYGRARGDIYGSFADRQMALDSQKAADDAAAQAAATQDQLDYLGAVSALEAKQRAAEAAAAAAAAQRTTGSGKSGSKSQTQSSLPTPEEELQKQKQQAARGGNDRVSRSQMVM